MRYQMWEHLLSLVVQGAVVSRVAVGLVVAFFAGPMPVLHPKGTECVERHSMRSDTGKWGLARTAELVICHGAADSGLTFMLSRGLGRISKFYRVYNSLRRRGRMVTEWRKTLGFP